MLVYALVLLAGAIATYAQDSSGQTQPVFLMEEEAVWREGMPESKGTVLPAFWNLELITLDGSTLHLSDYRGSYLLLNFWGEWCAPCLKELPMLVAAYERIPRARFNMVGLLVSYDEEQARQTLEAVGASWAQALIDRKLASQFDLLVYPMNVLIMPDGVSYEKRYLIDSTFVEQYVGY